MEYGVIHKGISLAVELRTFSSKTKYICAVWSMGYYTFDLLPLTTIHVIEFWLAKIIWAGQAFFAEPNSLKIRLLNKATDNTRNYGTIMGEWFACFVPCIFSNTVKTLRSSFWGKKIRLIFLLGLQNNRRVVLHFSVIKRATH